MIILTLCNDITATEQYTECYVHNLNITINWVKSYTTVDLHNGIITFGLQLTCHGFERSLHYPAQNIFLPK
jgi:hypothetical protein